MIKIGILDQGKRTSQNSLLTVENIIEYAVKADELGFSKFWLTEHHYRVKNHPYTNPDILIAVIAGMTENIHVGSAGVLLNIHTPISILTNYKLMNNMFNNRIDLGLSSSVTDINYVNNTLYSNLDKSTFREYFNKSVEKIVTMLYEEEKLFDNEGLVIPPYNGLKPSLWYLSVSYRNANFIIDNQLNIVRSIFHNYGQDLNNLDYKKDELIDFKERFFERNGYHPKVALSLAFYMSDNIRDSRLKIETADFGLEGKDKAYKVIPTTPNHLFDLIHEYQLKFGIDDFVFYDINGDNDRKIENLITISEKFNMQPVLL